jgi:DNA mismatch repair ATPase MutS
VAKLAGMPAKVVNRANEILKPWKSRTQEAELQKILKE